MADSQAQFWYPLSLLFSLIPRSYNWLVVFGYVLAGFFTTGFIARKTGSLFAGLVGGIIFSMSGFFIAHINHLTVIHTALWLPLILHALEELKNGYRPGWFFIGSFAIGAGWFEM